MKGFRKACDPQSFLPRRGPPFLQRLSDLIGPYSKVPIESIGFFNLCWFASHQVHRTPQNRRNPPLHSTRLDTARWWTPIGTELRQVAAVCSWLKKKIDLFVHLDHLTCERSIRSKTHDCADDSCKRLLEFAPYPR